MPGARTELFVRKVSGSLHVVANEGFTTGNIFFVSSGAGTDTTGYGANPDRPLATLDYAIGQCTANNGDRIYLMPGHAESISSAGGITADIAGVEIIGLGQRSNRPTFSFANTAATIDVSASSVTFRNIRVTPSVDEVVKMFNITASHCTLDAVDHFETTSMQTIQFAKVTSTNFTMQNCRHYQSTASTSAQKWVELTGGDRAVIQDNVFHLTLNNSSTTATLTTTTSPSIDLNVARNRIVQLGGTTQVSAILFITNTTGFVTDNRVATAVTNVAGSIALASCYGCENYALNSVNKNGFLEPVVDT